MDNLQGLLDSAQHNLDRLGAKDTKCNARHCYGGYNGHMTCTVCHDDYCKICMHTGFECKTCAQWTCPMHEHQSEALQCVKCLE